MNSIYDFLKNHGTKVLGFLQITLGAVAGVTGIIPDNHMKYYVVAIGLLTAWRGYFNSQQTAP